MKLLRMEEDMAKNQKELVEEIRRLPLKGTSVADLDKLLFMKWERNEISIRNVIRQFKRNNKVANRVEIDEDAMVIWLNSLGYLKEEQRCMSSNALIF